MKSAISIQLSALSKRVCLFVAALLLVTCHLPLATAQEITLTVPLHPAPRYDSTRSMFTLQQGVGATGALQQWKNTAGVVVTSIGPDGQLNFGTGALAGYGVNLAPATRPSGAQVYLVGIADGGGSSSGLMTGTAAQKTYGLGINLNRPTTSVATGDSNDALIKGTYNNYAANDANFLVRGINMVVNNRTGGTLGMVSGALLSSSSKSGSTTPIVVGAEINVENFGTNATSHIGADITIKNEAAKATTQAGVRIRNIDQSNVAAADAAILIPASAGNTVGWNVGVDLNGAAINTSDFRLHTGAQIFSGSGDPNGNLSGTDGSVYLRTGTATASTVLYICTGTTTWTAVTVP